MGYYVTVEKDVNVYVEDVGTGTPVVLIHGWPVNHHMFEYQTSQLPKYGYRTIGIDLRGFGKSDRPWQGYSYDRMADDIYEVLEALRLKNVRLIGFSMGGAIAIRYMARHAGKRVSQLILVGAAAPAFTQRPGFPYGSTKAEIDDLLEQVDKDRPQLLTDFGKNFFAQPISDSFRNWFQLLGLEADSHATYETLKSLRDEDLRADLSKIHVPTAIFHGKLDKITPYPLAIVMNEGIKGSLLVPFEHSGHGSFYDEREKFNKELLSFLDSLRYLTGDEEV
ncbi:alpha/beta hydrolase [Paenibacillus sp. SC116]|uniref:alpha/beta fold hydrolase n=1 Tax=Paenibacillus sp. SC116 TaxID=2968986 RepID=UPI00215B62A3|nr:alpha/beta hydrolase [Paenibacillus sp. SC116]MCR8845013.1 alpha/beta hydrolase [Paenibacillus sp. SC116]